MDELRKKPIPWEGIRWAASHIPAFEREGISAGGYTDIERAEGGGVFLPDYIFSDEMIAFLEGLYERGVIVDFNWPAWKEGERLHQHPEEIDSADAHTCWGLLIALVRADRFSSGLLASLIESGKLVRLLRRLQALDGTPPPPESI